MPFPLFLTPIFLLFAASQLYWLLRGLRLVRERYANPVRRWTITTAVVGAYILISAYNFGWFGRNGTPTRLTAAEALLVAPYLWWVFSSMAGFLVAAPIGAIRKLFHRKPVQHSPSRRHLLEHGATAVAAMPFVAGGYALLYGRLNLETTTRRIGLDKLPKAFAGFRIVQLSDIHIGPFMSEEEIRRYVEIAKGLRPDLIVLTGDFVTWDPATQQAVVAALSGLRAPFGVFGCLGNHDRWTGVEDSITDLFARAGVRILRDARAAVATRGESFNLIGVDYSRGPLPGVGNLMTPGVNILMSHNPNTFDAAAALGIDLSLSGHTHGGQVALEFISPGIAPSRLVTPYVAGWFQQPGGQLYVNRGIGTVGAPMRIGASPEITVFELGSRVS